MNTTDPTPQSDPAGDPEDIHHSSDQTTSGPSAAAGSSAHAADEDIPVNEAAKECENSREAFDDLVRAAKDAFRSGSDDARDAALNAIPRARESFNKGLHDLAYGLAYGLTFGSTLAREFTPEVMKNGFTEGSSAGREAAEGFVEKQRQAKAERQHCSRETSAPSEDPEEPSSPSHGTMRDDDAPGEPVYV